MKLHLTSILLISIFILGCNKDTFLDTNSFTLQEPDSKAGQQYSVLEVIPIDGTILNPCNLEIIDISGSYLRHSWGFISSSGNVTQHSHTNYNNVTGIGQESGEDYIINSVVNRFCQGNATLTCHYSLPLQVISTGSSGNFSVNRVYHSTVNANGEVTVSDSFGDSEGCQ